MLFYFIGFKVGRKTFKQVILSKSTDWLCLSESDDAIFYVMVTADWPLTGGYTFLLIYDISSSPMTPNVTDDNTI